MINLFSKLLDKHNEIDLSEMRYPGFHKKRAKEIELCVKNVANGKGWRDIQQCPLCNTQRRKILFTRFDINIVQCENCSLGYAQKFPIDVSDIYSHKEYLKIAKSDYLDNVEYRMHRFGRERLEIIMKHISLPHKKARILDIGCGTGWFLEAAKEAGFQVFGQEFGKDLSAFTAQRLGIKVWSVPLTEISLSEKFDVITLFDVLEHVSNPKEVIYGIKNHLSTNGIAIIFTPNLESLAFWKLKEQSSLVMPVEHLFYYTGKSLRMIFDQVGLAVIEFQTKGMDIPDLYSFYSEVMENNHIAEFLKENCSVLQAIVNEAKYANHMRFILKAKTLECKLQ